MIIGLDSNFLIDLLRGNPRAISLSKEAESGNTMVTTVVNYFEVMSGARNTLERSAAEVLFSRLKILEVSFQGVETSISIQYDLERKGKLIPPMDCLIAGTFKINNVEVIISRDPHFGNIAGLKLKGF